MNQLNRMAMPQQQPPMPSAQPQNATGLPPQLPISPNPLMPQQQPPMQPQNAMSAMGQQQPEQTQAEQVSQPMKPTINAPQNRTGNEFNGQIDVGGRKVNVTHGVLDGSTEENKVFVSADGKVVFNNKGQVMGSLDENNVLQKPDQALMDKLQKSGLTQPANGQQAQNAQPI